MKFLFPFFKTKVDVSISPYSAVASARCKIESSINLLTVSAEDGSPNIDANSKVTTLKFVGEMNSGTGLIVRNLHGTLDISSVTTPFFSSLLDVANCTLQSTLTLFDGVQNIVMSGITGLTSIVAVNKFPRAATCSVASLTSIDLTGITVLAGASGNPNYSGCGLNSATIEALLQIWADSGLALTCNISGGTNAAPIGGAGNANIVTIVANGGSVTHN